MSIKNAFIIKEGKDNIANYRGKPPILIPVEEFKKLIQAGKIRPAGLYELGRKQAYYVDVTEKENPHMYRRPFVMTGK